MAYVFSLSVECGDVGSARLVLGHFDGLPLQFSNGVVATCSAHQGPDPEGNFWVMVSVPGMTTNAPLSAMRSKERMTEAAHQLLNRLQTAPPFRYAMVGVEVDHFRYFSELGADLADLEFDGVVVSEAIWKHIGRPQVFCPFTDGYHWRPYRGESRGL